jgi:asparagine synthase (glutamine-hydrolysing)
MCGIVGILNADGRPVSAATLKSMTDILAHRGPDGEGQYIDGSLGFGHRRLAIIDLSPAASQPMSDASGDYTITYNGEIYNFQELRKELEAAGHAFRSRSDTEVALHAFKQWGPGCVERFNGMFALAVWDRKHKELFLARDRYGIKPLYYVQLGTSFLFASEIKAFLKHPDFKVEVSRPHLLEYFTFQNIFTDGTLFKDVRLLPPGHILTLRADGTNTQEQYWDFRFREPKKHLSDQEYRDALKEKFERAVQRQLVSDVEVGAYLSGGMDSGSVTAVTSRYLSHLNTFTCGFDVTSVSGIELGMDERKKAEALSHLFKTEHYEMVLKAGDMQRCLEKMAWHLEDPRVGQSYPNYYVSRLASKFVKVILSGMGGDELFAGYPWRYYRAVVNESFDQYVEKYYRFWHRLIPNRTIQELFVPDIWESVKDLRTIDIFRDVLRGHRETPTTPEGFVQNSLYLEAKTFLHGLLVVEDRLSMAHGLECRVPFLDNDLVDFAQQVPVRLKLRDLKEVVRLNENEPGRKTEKYYEQTRDGKILLREVMAQYVPEETIRQVKQGFSAPDASWFRGESIDYVRGVIENRSAHIYDFFRPETVRSLVQEHLEGKENRRLFLWSILNFEEWCRNFLKPSKERRANCS